MTSTKRAQPPGLRRRSLLDGLRRTSLLDAAQDGDSKKSDDSEATGEIARFKSIGRYGPARAEKLLPYEVRGDLEEEVEADINPMPTLAEYFNPNYADSGGVLQPYADSGGVLRSSGRD